MCDRYIKRRRNINRKYLLAVLISVLKSTDMHVVDLFDASLVREIGMLEHHFDALAGSSCGDLALGAPGVCRVLLGLGVGGGAGRSDLAMEDREVGGVGGGIVEAAVIDLCGGLEDGLGDAADLTGIMVGSVDIHVVVLLLIAATVIVVIVWTVAEGVAAVDLIDSGSGCREGLAGLYLTDVAKKTERVAIDAIDSDEIVWIGIGRRGRVEERVYMAEIDEDAARGVVAVVTRLATNTIAGAGVYWDFDAVGAKEGEVFQVGDTICGICVTSFVKGGMLTLDIGGIDGGEVKCACSGRRSKRIGKKRNGKKREEGKEEKGPTLSE